MISEKAAAGLRDPDGTAGKAGISGVLEGTNGRIMAKPNYTGTYHMVEQENMDTYLGALGTNLYAIFFYTVITVKCVFLCNR